MTTSAGNIIVFQILAAATILAFCVLGTEVLGKYRFPIHHKYSETVKKILNISGIPEKNSFEYHARMLHHDGRRLATKFGSTPDTSSGGDVTYQIGGQLGNLYYTIVYVGVPNKQYLVALDTGSDLSWIACKPCSGSSCALSLETNSGKILNYNQYNPNISTTSTIIPCASTKCLSGYCIAGTPTCYYNVTYVDGSYTAGSLVEDSLHLVSEDASQTLVDVSLTFGCATYRSRGNDPGLIGLGVRKYSLPSIVASEGIIADSFSLCFGVDGTGRMLLGDEGSLEQGETPFFDHPYFGSTYAFDMTQISVGAQVSNVVLTPLLDCGATYSYFEDPTYSIITKNFDLQVTDSRYQVRSASSFEYCYNLGGSSSGPDTPNVPNMSITLKGGYKVNLVKPIEIFVNEERDGYIYCLAIGKSVGYSVIGQNFLTGYQVIFDRERKLLGWKSSACGDEDSATGTPSQPPPSSLPPPPPSSLETPPSVSPPPPLRTPSPPLQTPPSPPLFPASSPPPPRLPLSPFSFPTTFQPPPPSSFDENPPPPLRSLVDDGSALKLNGFSTKHLFLILSIFSIHLMIIIYEQM